MAWMRYYDVPLKNCAIASYEFDKRPNDNLWEHTMLNVIIKHKNDTSLPIQHRFHVVNISREPMPMTNERLRPARENYAKMGRVEMGDQYHCTTAFALFLQGKMDLAHDSPFQQIKFFSVDKATAAARVTRDDWWILLREYVARGAKMKFCCGKLDIDGICCCGGWVHDEQQRVSLVCLSWSRFGLI